MAALAAAPDAIRYCFRQAPEEGAAPVRLAQPHGLAEHHALALAALLPLLGCGEEAAALAFDGLADRSDGPTTHALRLIAAEERHHDALIQGLQATLPTPADQADVLKAARRFHIRLGLGGPAAHLAKIAALDSAVCVIFSALLRPGTPLAGAAPVYRTLHGIHRDEARHVALSRGLAIAHGVTGRLRDAAADARQAFADIVRLAEESFDALHVDPRALDRALRRLPDGLLA